MNEWFGRILILTGNVVPNDPLPEHEQIALEIYARALKEIANDLQESF